MIIEGHEVSVSASAGLTTTTDGTLRVGEDFLREADAAMYHAKAVEHGSLSFFDQTMHAAATTRLRLQHDLRVALNDGQFVVHYQPIVPLDGSPVTHYEALVRWQHPERGLVPGEFLPVLESGPGIVELGMWILERVCEQLVEWRATGREATVAVNLSHREFWNPGLVDAVARLLRRHRLAASALELEITENVMLTDVDAARRVMGDLRELGVRLSIDDFGTGQSSLHTLRSFAVDILKIDGAFVRGMESDPQLTRLVSVILELGQALGLEVIAECVETSAQEKLLRAMGCTNAQGWLYSKAVPGDEAGAMHGARAPAGGAGPAPPRPSSQGACARAGAGAAPGRPAGLAAAVLRFARDRAARRPAGAARPAAAPASSASSNRSICAWSTGRSARWPSSDRVGRGRGRGPGRSVGGPGALGRPRARRAVGDGAPAAGRLGARSVAEAAALVTARLRDEPPAAGSLVVGYGYRDVLWADAPTAKDLDDAAERAGAPDAGGAGLRRPAQRVVLHGGGAAGGCAGRRGARARWFAVVGRLDPDEPTLDAWVADAARAAAARGLVGVVDYDLADNLASWRRRISAGATDLRVEAGVWREYLDGVLARELASGDVVAGTGGLLTQGSLKVISDGSLNTRTAYCHDPYPGPDGRRPAECSTCPRRAGAADGQGRARRGARGDPRDRRPGQRPGPRRVRGDRRSRGDRARPAARLADVARFAALGVAASIQPEHLVDDRDAIDAVWADRADRCYPFRTLHEAGVRLMLGSDAPVAPLDPWFAIAAAVTRTRDGREPWHPEQCLPAAVALAASVRSRVARGSRPTSRSSTPTRWATQGCCAPCRSQGRCWPAAGRTAPCERAGRAQVRPSNRPHRPPGAGGSSMTERTSRVVRAGLLAVARRAARGLRRGRQRAAGTAAAGGARVGFWWGLWHGLIAPITFVVSLFNHSVGIYEVHNNGGWYDFGFLLGLSFVFGGGPAGRSARRRRSGRSGSRWPHAGRDDRPCHARADVRSRAARRVRGDGRAPRDQGAATAVSPLMRGRAGRACARS